jgi:hypothetical protein
MRKKKEHDKDINPNQKRKSSQHKSTKNQNSILKLHEDKMNEFNIVSKEKVIKELNSSLQKNIEDIDFLKKDFALKRINKKGMSDLESDIPSKISRLEDANKTISEEIHYIKSGRKETDYILRTCNLVNDYILLEDRERDLMMKEYDTSIEQELYDLNQQKNDIIDDYMKVIDPNYTSFRKMACNRKDIYCEVCDSRLIPSSGFAVCYDCGLSKPTVQQAEELGYKELQELDYRPQFTYQKETHLEDWLRRFQAKENKEIPQGILDKVVMEAHKQRVKDLSTLTELQVKKYLKKLELNDYYDNVISIINRINKRPPFILTQEVESKVKEMFQQIQAPFEKYKDPSRKNMLSYSYLLHHFFLILGLPQFSKYFFLLKSPEKLRQQDQTFKKIVEELAKTDPKTPWKFYPSI